MVSLNREIERLRQTVVDNDIRNKKQIELLKRDYELKVKHKDDFIRQLTKQQYHQQSRKRNSIAIVDQENRYKTPSPPTTRSMKKFVETQSAYKKQRSSHKHSRQFQDKNRNISLSDLKIRLSTLTSSVTEQRCGMIRTLPFEDLSNDVTHKKAFERSTIV